MTRPHLLAALCAATMACASATPAPSSAPAPGSTPGSTPSASGRAPAIRSGALIYQPSTASYVLRRRDSVSVELPNGLRRTQVLSSAGYFSVATRAGTPMPIAITLDSLTVEGPLAAQSAIDSARGAHWTGSVSAIGVVSGLTAERTSSVAEQFRGMLPLVFPVLPAGGVREGAAWSNTRDDTMRVLAFNVREHAVDSARATADTARLAGKPWIAITTAAGFTRIGGGSQFGQAVEVRATGTRHLTSRLRPDGMLGSMDGTESSDMTLTVPAMGQTLPVKQDGTFSVRLLRAAR